MPLRTHSNFARSAVFLEGEPPRLPPAQVGTGGAIKGGYQRTRVASRMLFLSFLWGAKTERFPHLVKFKASVARCQPA